MCAFGTEQENSASCERLQSARRHSGRAYSSSSSWPRLSQTVSFAVYFRLSALDSDERFFHRGQANQKLLWDLHFFINGVPVLIVETKSAKLRDGIAQAFITAAR